MPKIDRRIQRSRQAIRQAMIELALERGYANISVQDILDRANVGRSTFYAHFRDKEDIFIAEFDRIFAEFQHRYGASTPLDAARARQLSLFICEHIQANRPLFKALWGKQGGQIVGRHAEKIFGLMARDALAGRQTPVPPEALAHHIVHAFIALLEWWVDQDEPYTAAQINALYWQLVTPTLDAVFE